MELDRKGTYLQEDDCVGKEAAAATETCEPFLQSEWGERRDEVDQRDGDSTDEDESTASRIAATVAIAPLSSAPSRSVSCPLT